MKVAVFSDVQGVYPALEVVVEDIQAWDPDLVIMDGDLINRGPSSLKCLELFKRLRSTHGWLPVRGNHEEFVSRCGKSPPKSDAEAQMRSFADWTRVQIGDHVDSLADWPDHLCFHPPGGSQWVHVTHGTLAGNRDGISNSVSDESLAGKLPEDIALFVTAHTHKPLQRTLGSTRILNVGSVGSPFDGDPRASYGQLLWRDTGWDTRIVRVGYDRQRAERDFRDSGFFDHGGPLAAIIFEEWRRAQLMMPRWNRRYLDAVRNGDIELGKAVNEFLQTIA